MPNWDILCLLALESWYKCKIIQSAVFSENIAMGRSISKIFWNGVNWGQRARTKCDESFAVLYMKLFWHFWELLWLFSMFWIRTPSQTSKKWRNWVSFYSFDSLEAWVPLSFFWVLRVQINSDEFPWALLSFHCQFWPPSAVQPLSFRTEIEIYVKEGSVETCSSLFLVFL